MDGGVGIAGRCLEGVGLMEPDMDLRSVLAVQACKMRMEVTVRRWVYKCEDCSKTYRITVVDITLTCLASLAFEA